MLDDIKPTRPSVPKDVPRQPMRGMRLRGHTPDVAKERIAPGSTVVKEAAPIQVKEAPVVLPKPQSEIETIVEGADVPKSKVSGRFAKLAFWKNWKSWSKKQKALFIVAVIIVIGLLAGGVYALTSSKSPVSLPKISKPKAAVVKPTTVASPLTGTQVAPALAARPVTGIMIENSDAARPQSGLQDAGVVYEAIAEAGITRFLALFQDSTPQYIGPVRSLRPYYIDYAAPFQASIAHVGGSPDALAEVQNGNFRNLDEFTFGDSFHRIDSRDAPHNVYTSFDDLDKLNQSKGYTSSKFTSWPRKADKKIATPTAKTIDFSISSSDFYAHYDYDAKTNTYLRSEGGAPHLDYVSAADTTGTQLSPKVVVAMVVPETNGALDSSGAYYSDYTDSGTGVAYIFQDGGVTQGTWTKGGTTDQVQFTDAGGHPVAFNAGQTWISLVDSTDKVVYKP